MISSSSSSSSSSSGSSKSSSRYRHHLSLSLVPRLTLFRVAVYCRILCGHEAKGVCMRCWLSPSVDLDLFSCDAQVGKDQDIRGLSDLRVRQDQDGKDTVCILTLEAYPTQKGPRWNLQLWKNHVFAIRLRPFFPLPTARKTCVPAVTEEYVEDDFTSPVNYNGNYIPCELYGNLRRKQLHEYMSRETCVGEQELCLPLFWTVRCVQIFPMPAVALLTFFLYP